MSAQYVSLRVVEPLRNGEDLLSHLLKMQSRRLTQQQVAAVMRVSAQSDQTQTPLFLPIVADQVKGCTSFNEVPPLSSSVKQLILSFFNSLHKLHGHRVRLVTKTARTVTQPRGSHSHEQARRFGLSRKFTDCSVVTHPLHAPSRALLLLSLLLSHNIPLPRVH